MFLSAMKGHEALLKIIETKTDDEKNWGSKIGEDFLKD